MAAGKGVKCVSAYILYPQFPPLVRTSGSAPVEWVARTILLHAGDVAP